MRISDWSSDVCSSDLAAILSDNRFGLETALRSAIEEDRLHLAFQPLVELATGKVAGFEALARWDNGEGQAVPPTEFIPIAEDSGLIVPLGQWAIGKIGRAHVCTPVPNAHILCRL